GPGPPPRPVTPRLAPRVPLAMPNDEADMSALANMSAGRSRGPIDAQLLYPRLERGALETQARGSSVRTSEHPVALGQRAENRIALRHLGRGRAGKGRTRRRTGHAPRYYCTPSGEQRRRRPRSLRATWG